ncbi:hypothetical protein MRGA423_16485 [Mycobacterium tuberculosis RGTB423]|nr:hypothetical protein MRGA423_16485 [Mycobacterium tuberculosis RGTB423]
MINPTRARRMRYRLAAMAGMPEGKLILLNGGSSAGKTSLALAFQDLAAECWMHIGIDLFWFALPPEQLDLARVRPEYYTWDSAVEADGLEWFTVHPGPILDLAMHSRYRAIRAYLDNGMNVIADDVIWTREWLVDALRVFEGCRVWMVRGPRIRRGGCPPGIRTRRSPPRVEPRQCARCPRRRRVRLRAGYHRDPGPRAGQGAA